jgi:hypothetical protein
MIAPEHEQPQSEPGAEFFDSVSIDFSDSEQGLLGLVRVTRYPNQGRSIAAALLFADGELLCRERIEANPGPEDWEAAELNGLRLTTETPLERWGVELSSTDAALELEVDAAFAPIDIAEAATAAVARAAGSKRYEQLCELRGSARVRGANRPISGSGRRQHTWGAHDWKRLGRWRSLYAISGEQTAITVAGALPAESAGHGDELQAGYLVAAAEPARPFEELRLSTVFEGDGLPGSAGLELYMPGDEFPRRLAGESVCATSIELGSE